MKSRAVSAATATAIATVFFFVLLFLATTAIVALPGINSVNQMLRGGNSVTLGSNRRNGERKETTTSTSSPVDHAVFNLEDCRICGENTSDMGEDKIVRCKEYRHPHCLRCYATLHLQYKFDPTYCVGCATDERIDLNELSPEQKGFYAQCQVEVAEKIEKTRMQALEARRRALLESQTPFMRALKSENSEDEARCLIAQGDIGDVNAVDLLGQSTLMYAIEAKREEIMQQLLEYSIRTNQFMDVKYVNQRVGVSTLMYALFFSDTTSEGLQQLLDYSIRTNQLMDVKYVNQRVGVSTLMYAISGRTSKHMQQLFEYAIQTGQSIDVNNVNQQNGLTPLMIAVSGRTSQHVLQLFDYSSQTGQSIDVNYVHEQTGLSTFEYALRQAWRTDNPEEGLNIIRLLIHHPSFDINRPLNERGETPLMLALSVKGGNADVVKELLNLLGIDLNQRSNDGKSIEQYALHSSNDEIRKLWGVRETWSTRLQEMLERWGYGPPLI